MSATRRFSPERRVLNLSSFYRADEARAALAAAMRLLARADALIVDMPENGGAPDTVALLAAYLFDVPGKPLFQIVPRSGDSQLYTTPMQDVDPRDGARPVSVTSARTFSAGEGFAFILQEEHRAVVVGEQTAGAANPGRAYPAGDDFEVTVPNGQVRTSTSQRNWEGTGVKPDVAVPAAQAQTKAHDSTACVDYANARGRMAVNAGARSGAAGERAVVRDRTFSG